VLSGNLKKCSFQSAMSCFILYNCLHDNIFFFLARNLSVVEADSFLPVSRGRHAHYRGRDKVDGQPVAGRGAQLGGVELVAAVNVLGDAGPTHRASVDEHSGLEAE
jgi:hypothetical protein